MNLAEIVEGTLDKSVATKTKKVVGAFTTELKRFDKKAKVEVEILGPFTVRFTSQLTKYFDKRDIEVMWQDLAEAVIKADEAGHIFKIDEDGSGEDFVRGLLTGLKPGMVVKAEAFFPTVGFTIKWKQIISTKRI